METEDKQSDAADMEEGEIFEEGEEVDAPSSPKTDGNDENTVNLPAAADTVDELRNNKRSRDEDEEKMGDGEDVSDAGDAGDSDVDDRKKSRRRRKRRRKHDETEEERRERKDLKRKKKHNRSRHAHSDDDNEGGKSPNENDDEHQKHSPRRRHRVESNEWSEMAENWRSGSRVKRDQRSPGEEDGFEEYYGSPRKMSFDNFHNDNDQGFTDENRSNFNHDYGSPHHRNDYSSEQSDDYDMYDEYNTGDRPPGGRGGPRGRGRGRGGPRGRGRGRGGRGGTRGGGQAFGSGNYDDRQRGEPLSMKQIKKSEKFRKYVEAGGKVFNKSDLAAKSQEKPKQPCRFFQEGHCTKGRDCPFSHEFGPIKRAEVCKFYIVSQCTKGDNCIYMHNEFPCKYYQTGAPCYAGEKCKFSHANPMSEEQREILERIIDKRDANHESTKKRSPIKSSENRSSANDKKIPSLLDLDLAPPPKEGPRFSSPGSGPRPGFYQDTFMSPQRPPNMRGPLLPTPAMPPMMMGGPPMPPGMSLPPPPPSANSVVNAVAHALASAIQQQTRQQKPAVQHYQDESSPDRAQRETTPQPEDGDEEDILNAVSGTSREEYDDKENKEPKVSDETWQDDKTISAGSDIDRIDDGSEAGQAKKQQVFEIPNNLPPVQRQLMLRLRQVQHETDGAGGGSPGQSSAPVPEEPIQDVTTKERRSKKEKRDDDDDEDWYSASSDEEDKVVPKKSLSDVLKDIAQKPPPRMNQPMGGMPPLPMPPFGIPPPSFDINGMLSFFRHQSSQPNMPVPNTPGPPCLPPAPPAIRDPRRQGADPRVQVRDPRSGPSDPRSRQSVSDTQQNSPLSSGTPTINVPTSRSASDPRLVGNRDPRVVNAPNAAGDQSPSGRFTLPPLVSRHGAPIDSTEEISALPTTAISYILRPVMLEPHQRPSLPGDIDKNDPKWKDDPRFLRYSHIHVKPSAMKTPPSLLPKLELPPLLSNQQSFPLVSPAISQSQTIQRSLSVPPADRRPILPDPRSRQINTPKAFDPRLQSGTVDVVIDEPINARINDIKTSSPYEILSPDPMIHMPQLLMKKPSNSLDQQSISLMDTSDSSDTALEIADLDPGQSAANSSKASLSHRYDPRFKRRPSKTMGDQTQPQKGANVNDKQIPGVNEIQYIPSSDQSYKEKFEYTSPLGGVMEDKISDSYSSYNRPPNNNSRLGNVDPRGTRSNPGGVSLNGETVDTQSKGFPVPTEGFPVTTDSDPLIPDNSTQMNSSLKQMFNTIDPTASPFC